MSKHRIFLIIYFFLMAAAFMVPSDGDHGVFSIKSLSFLLFFFSTLGYCFATQRLSSYQLRLLLFMLLGVTFLLIWIGIGFALDQSPMNMQIGQFRLFLLTMMIPIMTLYLVDEGLLTPQTIFRCTIYSSFIYIFVKISLVILHLLGVINLWDILLSLKFRYMSMNILGGLERLQTSMDIATPFLLLFILKGDHLRVHFNPKFRSIYILFALFSTFLSFSRFLLFVLAIVCIIYWMSLDLRRWMKVTLMITMALCSLYFTVGSGDLGLIIEKRFFSKDNEQSDLTRVDQINAMMERFNEDPLMGNGIGGFAPKQIRDPGMWYLYEVQWVSFLMQFGVIGIIGLVTPLLIILFKFINAPFSRARYAFLALFGLWVVSGFTNPFLISLTSGIMYTLFYLAASICTANPKQITHTT